MVADSDDNHKVSNAPVFIESTCKEKEIPEPWNVAINIGAFPLGHKSAASSQFETFSTDWKSARFDQEVARAWTEIPPAIRIVLKYPVTHNSLVYFRLGLRRDLRAWNEDGLGMNLPLTEKEVDLNEPSLGFFHLEETHWAFTVGRFPVHWSPSPDFGLALSNAVPYHNGFEMAFKLPRLRYRFLASSLNPWLEGTPLGNSASEDFPVGSEEYRQRHYGSANGASIFHNRVYDARIKTLFAHRVEGEAGPLSLGITETQVIGGKAPDFRDAGPFVFFHNDFKEGFANGSLGLDAALRLPFGIALAGEYYIDDVNYSETESEGNTANLKGFMVGARHAFTMRGWEFLQGVHAIKTDPYLYGYLQPLNTMASRHILSSNRQLPGDSLFIDKYVIDYPMGYLRGGDAMDFWYRLDAWRGTNLHFGLALAWLSKGEVEIGSPYEGYYSSSHDSPSGTPEREFRSRLEADLRIRTRLDLHAGLAWRSIRNLGHASGEDEDLLSASCGVAWSLPN